MIRKAMRRFLEVLAVFWWCFNLGAGYMNVFSCENEWVIRLWLLCFGVCMLLFHNVYWRKKIKPCLHLDFVLPNSVLTHLSNCAIILGSVSFFPSSVCVFSKRLITTQVFSELTELSCWYVVIYPLEQFGITYTWMKASPRGKHGNPLQYSCLENPMDRGASQATCTHTWMNSKSNSSSWTISFLRAAVGFQYLE